MSENKALRWVKCEDGQLPDIGEYVLIYNTEGAILVGRRFSHDWKAFFADGEKYMGELTAIYWMPLPNTPDQPGIDREGGMPPAQLPEDVNMWVRAKEDEYSHQKSDQDAYRQGAIDLYWEWALKHNHPVRLSFVKFAYGCMRERDILQASLSSIKAELSKVRTKCCTEHQIAERYFPAQCPGCGFKGSSSEWHGGGVIADTGDYSDPICPVCGHLDMDEIENEDYSDVSQLLLKHLGEAREKADGFYWDLDAAKREADYARTDRDLYKKESDSYCNLWMEALTIVGRKNLEIAEMKDFLREVVMRANLAFPETEQDLKWFEDGMSPKAIMERLFSKLKLTENAKKEETKL